MIDIRRFTVVGRSVVHDRRYLQLTGAYRRKGIVLNAEALKEEWFSVDRTKQRLEPTIEGEAKHLFLNQRDDIIAHVYRLEDVKSDDQWRAGIKALAEVIDPETLRSMDSIAWRPTTMFSEVVTREALIKQSLLVERIFDIDAWKDETERRFRPIFPAVIQEGWDTGNLRIGVEGTSFSLDNARAQRTLNQNIRLVRGINDETARLLVLTIDNWLDNDTDTTALADDIAAKFNQYSIGRAGRIARTSTGSLFEGGQMQAFEEAEIEKKRWLSRRDGKVRTGAFNHEVADGEEVELDKPFTRTGENLDHPLDPAGSPGNTIECRCTSLPVIEAEEDQG